MNSVIQQGETPLQWRELGIQIALQELVSEKKRIIYQMHCPYALPYGKGKLVDYNYYRSRIHRSHVTICLDCMKLIYANDVKPKKVHYFTRDNNRYIEMIKQSDMIK